MQRVNRIRHAYSKDRREIAITAFPTAIYSAQSDGRLLSKRPSDAVRQHWRRAFAAAISGNNTPGGVRRSSNAEIRKSIKPIWNHVSLPAVNLSCKFSLTSVRIDRFPKLCNRRSIGDYCVCIRVFGAGKSCVCVYCFWRINSSVSRLSQ